MSFEFLTDSARNIALEANRDVTGLRRLLTCHHQIVRWLAKNGITPRFSCVTPCRSHHFKMEFEFEPQQWAHYMALRKQFWSFAHRCLTISDDLVDGELVALSPVIMPPPTSNWSLSVTPHPDGLLHQFPSARFWEGLLK